MAKYLLLKHYRGAPAPVNNIPMDQWTPDEVEAHIRFMRDFANRLEGTGEFVDGQALNQLWARNPLLLSVNEDRHELFLAFAPCPFFGCGSPAFHVDVSQFSRPLPLMARIRFSRLAGQLLKKSTAIAELDKLRI